MFNESELIEILSGILKGSLNFMTYSELQITSKNLNLEKMVNQKSIRIDLAGFSSIDGTIHFFEAETGTGGFHIQHPSIYRHFSDYCYLVCPDESIDLLNEVSKQQQFNWASKLGIGIITISKDKRIRILGRALKQKLLQEVRAEVLRCMEKRYEIDYSKVPIWNRKREQEN